MGSKTLKRRGFVGLELRASADPGEPGLLVGRVAPAAAAAGAGVQVGDRVTHIAGRRVKELGEVRPLLRALRAGDILQVGVVRKGAELELSTKVTPYPIERYVHARVILDEVKVADHALRAIAVVPDTPGPHPVLYYLPGAHWTSEEHPLEPTHPLPALLQELASVGIASLRVERSGLGDSQGPPCTRVDFESEHAGYRAGFELLEHATWADARRVFLFGHSLGAMHAPLLAEQTAVQGVITFGAGAVPISEGLIGAIQRHAERQLGATARARGEQIAELIRLIVCSEKTPANVFAERPDLAAIAPSHMVGDRAYHRVVTFYHQLEKRDISGAWQACQHPVLALHGDRDIITTLKDSEQIVRWVGDKARARALPGVDHHMSDGAPGAPPRLAAAVSQAVIGWLHEHGT